MNTTFSPSVYQADLEMDVKYCWSSRFIPDLLSDNFNSFGKYGTCKVRNEIKQN
jgi:hypothetical protein